MPAKPKQDPQNEPPASTTPAEAPLAAAADGAPPADTVDTGGEAHAAAAELRATAYATAHPDRARREIDALLEERRGYVQRGKTDRVELVDEQIRLRGGTPPDED